MTTSNEHRHPKPRLRLAAARRRRGWGQVRAAIEINQHGLRLGYPEDELRVDAHMLSRWERGVHEPKTRYIRIMCSLYELAADQLDLAPPVSDRASPAPSTPADSAVVPLANQADLPVDAEPYSDSGDLKRREFTLLTILGLAGLPGVALAPRLALEVARHGFADTVAPDDWHDIVAQYGRDYMTTSPASLLDSLLVDAASLQMTLANSSAVHRRDLQGVAAMLDHFVALTLGNLGRMHEANRWWRTANRLAADSGDPYTIAWVKGCELARAFYENRPTATLIQLAEQVDSLTLAAPAAAVTELLVGKTQLLTALGRHDEVEPTLERFREAVATLPSAPSEQNDSWLAWAENRLRFAESFAYSYQGRLTQAEEAQQRAIALYPSWYRRGPIKIELQRALAFIRSGDVTAGIRHAHTIISSAGPANHDWPIIEFGREVLQRVPPGEHDGIVAEFRDYLALPEATT